MLNFSQDLGINLGWRGDLWYARHVTLTQSLGWLGPVAPVPPFTSLTHFLQKLLNHEYIITYFMPKSSVRKPYPLQDLCTSSPCPERQSFVCPLLICLDNYVQAIKGKVFLIRVVFLFHTTSCNLCLLDEIKEDRSLQQPVYDNSFIH